MHVGVSGCDQWGGVYAGHVFPSVGVYRSISLVHFDFDGAYGVVSCLVSA